MKLIESHHTNRLSPDPQRLNVRRARRAAAALAAYRRRTGADPEGAVSDLLTDLMHWCDQSGHAFAEALDRAVSFHGPHGDELTVDQPRRLAVTLDQQPAAPGHRELLALRDIAAPDLLAGNPRPKPAPPAHDEPVGVNLQHLRGPVHSSIGQSVLPKGNIRWPLTVIGIGRSFGGPGPGTLVGRSATRHGHGREESSNNWGTKRGQPWPRRALSRYFRARA